MEHFEKTLEKETVFEGKIINVRVDKAELENGETARREVVEHPGGVGIVALDADGNVLMVKQFRYAFGKELLELPAGKLEYGEDHRACGLRELSEETGNTANRFEYLGCLYPSPAYLTEITHLYYATDLQPTRQHLDDDEFLSVHRIPLSEAVRMVLDGEILDAKTQIALLKVSALKNAGKV